MSWALFREGLDLGVPMRRVAGIVPIVGVAAFVALYFYAALLYSAATTADPASRGYQHLHNYWCDLYDTVTYTGQVNASRPYAMAATLIMTVVLAFFFVSVTALFAPLRRLCLVVRVAGVLSMVIASLIFTPLHDLVIKVGVPLGAVAIVGTCVGMARQRAWGLVALAIVAVTVCVGDYAIWVMGLLHFYQPMIQKAAFALFFLWVVVTALRVVKKGFAVPGGAGILSSLPVKVAGAAIHET
jgi:hypothetical protein